MTQGFDDQLKKLFAEAEAPLPREDFVVQVMSELQKRHRRQRFILSFGLLTTLAFLWLSFPTVEPALRIVAVYPRIIFGIANESLVAVAQSPLTYIYGAAFGGYLLRRLLSRFPISLV